MRQNNWYHVQSKLNGASTFQNLNYWLWVKHFVKGSQWSSSTVSTEITWVPRWMLPLGLIQPRHSQCEFNISGQIRTDSPSLFLSPSALFFLFSLLFYSFSLSILPLSFILSVLLYSPSLFLNAHLSAAKDLQPVGIVFTFKVPRLCQEKQLENWQPDSKGILQLEAGTNGEIIVTFAIHMPSTK